MAEHNTHSICIKIVDTGRSLDASEVLPTMQKRGMVMAISTLLYVIAAGLFLVQGYYWVKRKKRLGAWILSMGTGIGSLALAWYLLAGAGISFAVNYFTLLVSAAGGPPGVVALVAFRLLA